MFEELDELALGGGLGGGFGSGWGFGKDSCGARGFAKAKPGPEGGGIAGFGFGGGEAS